MGKFYFPNCCLLFTGIAHSLKIKMASSTGVFLKSILPWKVTVFQRFSLKSGTLWHIMTWFATSAFWGRNGKNPHFTGKKRGRFSIPISQSSTRDLPGRLRYTAAPPMSSPKDSLPHITCPSSLLIWRQQNIAFVCSFSTQTGKIWGINPHKKQLIYNLTCTSVLLHDFIKKSHNVKL